MFYFFWVGNCKQVANEVLTRTRKRVMNNGTPLNGKDEITRFDRDKTPDGEHIFACMPANL
jgi:hypothetical protein